MIQTKRDLTIRESSTSKAVIQTIRVKDRDKIDLSTVVTNHRNHLTCPHTVELIQAWLQLLSQVNLMVNKPTWVVNNSTCLHSNNKLQTNHNNFTSHLKTNSTNHLKQISNFLSNNIIQEHNFQINSKEACNNNRLHNSNNRNP